MSFVEGSWFVEYQKHLIEAIFLVTILFAIGIIFRLRFQGKESNLKKKILVRHMLYLLLFFLEFLNYLMEVYASSIDKAIKEKFKGNKEQEADKKGEAVFKQTLFNV